jgi:hypothetical protein
MYLTQDDLTAIRGIVEDVVDKKIDKKLDEKLDKKLDEKLAPVWATLKELLNTQLDMVNRIQCLEFQIEGLKTDFYNLRNELTG